ncbi:3-hydroxyacyl-CoA dehydrogenase/enoyl-CoA hydratase family protein [Mesorhizobium australicum]|uniref:3-hydroxyacyl-CoA dehydrogenase/enoyl-CoA hydratase family protein n=1 Tax=Mesorhizobium australicum TaxID=536018 RepID=UPI001AECD4C5|nr:3-hydroxyacyl-CoA dehydrogenase NAD-binding domain-containing protein [Mesorhizobium australicum]
MPTNSDEKEDAGQNALISRAAVIGAGSMGSGIAAHLANAGVPVLLLDIVPDGASDRDTLAKAAVERQIKAGGFMHPERAALIEVGNVEDDLGRIVEADWIIEAVFEDLEIKKALYRRVDEARRAGSIVSSNTSTIPLGQLIEGASPRFKGDFVITHFFNPPRHMQLLELVASPATRRDVLERITAIGDRVLGKSTVLCRDTPGFIANRVGNYWMSVAALEAMRLGLTVEEADAVMSTPFGIPRTGVFGLFDYVGINLVPLVWGSFMRTLAPEDAHRDHDITADPFFADMLRRGLVGRFGPGGFYRRKAQDGGRVDEAIDLRTGEYRPRRKPELESLSASDLRSLCAADDRGGRYAWSVFSHLIGYVAAIAPEIGDDVAAIDLTMRLGYNWSEGPFQLADRVGPAWIIDRLQAEQRQVPPLLRRAAELGGFYPEEESVLGTDGVLRRAEHPEGVLALASVKKSGGRVDGNESASLWNLGDGVAGLEIHTKMNACDMAVVEQVEQALNRVSADFQALVIGSDNKRAFSAGAKLDVFIALVKAGDWAGLESFVARGQAAWLGLKYAQFPVVAAAGGLALGGGCELMMHADEVVAHAELYAGLPERKVGIIPGWGGVTQVLLRAQERSADAPTAAVKAFDLIAGGEVTSSALSAVDAGFLRASDRIVMNRDRLLAVAKARAIELAVDYAAPNRAEIAVDGAAATRRLEERIAGQVAAGGFTETDAGVARELARVVAGGVANPAVLSELDLMRLELSSMLELARRPTTLERLEHMRATNKPLLN